MTSDNFFNPQAAGTASLGQSQSEESTLIKNINSNRWFIWVWVALNIGAAFVSSMAAGNGIGGSIFAGAFIAGVMGVPAFLLFRNQGFYPACMLFAFAIFNAISGIVMAANGMIQANIGMILVGLALVVVTGMIALDARKLRILRKERS